MECRVGFPKVVQHGLVITVAELGTFGPDHHNNGSSRLSLAQASRDFDDRVGHGGATAGPRKQSANTHFQSGGIARVLCDEGWTLAKREQCPLMSVLYLPREAFQRAPNL